MSPPPTTDEIPPQSAPKMSYEAAVKAITGSGSPFELAIEDVNGVEMPVFKNRFRSLREVLEKSVEFGSAELAVWDNSRRARPVVKRPVTVNGSTNPRVTQSVPCRLRRTVIEKLVDHDSGFRSPSRSPAMMSVPETSSGVVDERL